MGLEDRRGVGGSVGDSHTSLVSQKQRGNPPWMEQAPPLSAPVQRAPEQTARIFVCSGNFEVYTTRPKLKTFAAVGWCLFPQAGALKPRVTVKCTTKIMPPRPLHGKGPRIRPPLKRRYRTAVAQGAQLGCTRLLNGVSARGRRRYRQVCTLSLLLLFGCWWCGSLILFLSANKLV